MVGMKDLAVGDRPREKLLRMGGSALSDGELLAVILGSGNARSSVFDLAQKIIEVVDRRNLSLCVDDLVAIAGIGEAKACALVGALEFSRRRIASQGVKIRTPSDVVPLIQHLSDRKQETFICVSLNGAHEVIASRIVTVGLANVCQVHPREVFADPLTDRACAVVVAHNHPSGDLTPSSDDYSVTSRLKDAAQILGITFLDHIIFSQRGFRSLMGA